MRRWIGFVIALGVLIILFLMTRRVVAKEPVVVMVEQQRTVPIEVEVEVEVEVEAQSVRYEGPEDPLLYVDDGMYYRNPETIEGNNVWIEQRPKTNDLEWGYPLYSDRWSGGIYNGSYKTYSS
jgi:hypothetical protein